MRIALFLITGFLTACSNNGTGKPEGEHKHDTSTAQKDSSKKSIPSEAKKQIGNTDIKISYNAPAVRGRVIWGGLVPYDAVWVTGAHSATTIEIGKDFRVGDKRLPAGKYALFTIPGRDEWAIILNKNWDQHLTDEYSEADDVARVKAKPEATAEVTERLKYEIDQTGERSATIVISWEKVKVAFGVEVL
jgi:hypothetical protein